MTEQEYVEACRATLALKQVTATDRRSLSGVWIVQGTDRNDLPFVCGHPDGRVESWRAACRMHNVQEPHTP